MLTTSATLFGKKLTFQVEKQSTGYRVWMEQFPDMIGEGRIIQEAVRAVIEELKFHLHIYNEAVSKNLPLDSIEEFQKVYNYFTSD